MDIVRITLMGSGFDVVRGIVTKKEYNKIKNSLDNVWIKDLNKKITQYNNSDNNYDSVINTIMSLRKLQPIPKPQIVGGSKKKKRSIHPFLIF